jgi:ATP-dependent DNA ligase
MKEGASRSFSFIEPMNALPVQKLPEGDWLYEVKFDGYRALASKSKEFTQLKGLQLPSIARCLETVAR